MNTPNETRVQLIPVTQIRVVNPRAREKKKFDEIVESISKVGLKKPITVTQIGTDKTGQSAYELICGQGRLEAYLALGQTEIPAFVRRMTKTEGMLASLIENIARRKMSGIDQMKTVQWMKDQDQSVADIALKTGLTEGYVKLTLALLRNGEERLLDAVLLGRIPIAIAMKISGMSDEDSQKIMMEAYEKKEFNEKTLTAFKRIVEHRKFFGRSGGVRNRSVGKKPSVESMVLAYRRESQRQRLLVKESENLRSEITGFVRRLQSAPGRRRLCKPPPRGRVIHDAQVHIRTSQKIRMNPPVKTAFSFDGVTVRLDVIFPIRQVKTSDHAFGKFKAIVASIKEVGVIEPLVIYPQRGAKGTYVLLDGHLRLRALRELGKTETFCIIAKTDDAFSYNHQINRISIIQEHKMIVRAIERGVTPEQIAKALAVDVSKIAAGMNLLDGIHPDAVDLLKSKPITAFALRLLRKAKSVRQIDIAHLMVSGNNFTRAYAEALIVGTPPDQLVHGSKTKTGRGLTAEELARLESEMEILERDYRLSQDGFGENSLHLNGMQRYVKRLLENAKIKRFLSTRYAELFDEFEDLVALQSLG